MSESFIDIARDFERVIGEDLIDVICDQFVELHGDRNYRDDPSIIGGIGLIKGQPVTIIAQNKGHEMNDRYKTNNGMTSPEGYHKALRLMKQAEKFNRPIITIIDTSGAYPGIDAEERGQGHAIATNLYEMSDLTVPVISILLSEGGSGGALALGVCDYMLMFENAYYSVISPEGFASILLKDGSKSREVAEDIKIKSDDLLDFGVIEEIISEPNGNIKLEELKMRKNELQDKILEPLSDFKAMSKTKLITHRYNRFKKFGEK